MEMVPAMQNAVVWYKVGGRRTSTRRLLLVFHIGVRIDLNKKRTLASGACRIHVVEAVLEECDERKTTFQVGIK